MSPPDADDPTRFGRLGGLAWLTPGEAMHRASHELAVDGAGAATLDALAGPVAGR